MQSRRAKSLSSAPSIQLHVESGLLRARATHEHVGSGRQISSQARACVAVASVTGLASRGCPRDLHRQYGGGT